MARCLSPLFSESARGKFGRSLIFGRVKNWPTVRFATPPRFTQTNPQKVIRRIYGIIIADWRIADQSIKNIYVEKAKGKPLLPVNTFFEEFFWWMFEARYGDSHYGIGRYQK